MYCTRENFGGVKIGKFGKYEPLPKFSLLMVTDTPKIYLAYALTVVFPKLTLPIALTCMVHQNVSLPQFYRVRYLGLS